MTCQRCYNCHVDFPKPEHASVNKTGNHKSMTKLPKTISQKARCPCDADFTKAKQFDSIIKQNAQHGKIGNDTFVVTTEAHEVPNVSADQNRPVRQNRQEDF